MQKQNLGVNAGGLAAFIVELWAFCFAPCTHSQVLMSHTFLLRRIVYILNMALLI